MAGQAVGMCSAIRVLHLPLLSAEDYSTTKKEREREKQTDEEGKRKERKEKEKEEKKRGKRRKRGMSGDMVLLAVNCRPNDY